jgi:hypothetical protein
MTYEELLANIASRNYRESRTLETPYIALRAVAELHKPITQADGSVICDSCSNSEFFPYKDCPTIKAIEKELHG